MFQDEAAKAFDAFKELNEKDFPEPEEPAARRMRFKSEMTEGETEEEAEEMLPPRVNLNALANGFKDFAWNLKQDPEVVMKQYNISAYSRYMSPR